MRIGAFLFPKLDLLLQAHPGERVEGIRYAEEARGERLANLIRFAFAMMWLFATSFYLGNNRTAFNLINMGSGLILMGVSVAYHLWLFRHAYKPYYKYVLTTSDLLICIGILVAYAVVAGPVFVLKMPIYLTILCCVGLAALRIQKMLAIYAGVLAVVLLIGFWAWMQLWYGIDYGSREEHAFADKVNATYLVDTLVFLIGFGFLTVVAAYNIRRQVDLRILAAEQSARQEERSVLAAGLAHEIRNPLTSIYGAAQLIRESPEELERYSGMILSDTRRLSGILEGFLKYARPFPLHPAWMDVAARVEGFCSAQTQLFPEAPTRYEGESAGVLVLTDAEAVLQVLINLVQNARRYQVSGSAVRVRLHSRSGEIEISVEDDGPGIKPEDREHLFSRFRSDSPEGTGLGLALSRKIAQALGGDLKHEPLNPGARFVFTLSHYQGNLG